MRELKNLFHSKTFILKPNDKFRYACPKLFTELSYKNPGKIRDNPKCVKVL